MWELSKLCVEVTTSVLYAAVYLSVSWAIGSVAPNKTIETYNVYVLAMRSILIFYLFQFAGIWLATLHWRTHVPC